MAVIPSSVQAHARLAPCVPLVPPAAGFIRSLPPAGRLLSVVCFVLVVVATPVGDWAAFAGYTALIGLLLASNRVPLRRIVRQAAIELPFLAFAVALPFVAAGPRTECLGVSVSLPGLLGGLTLALKSTLGVLAAIALAATTSSRELLAAVEQLRLPALLVSIMAFMVRYGQVLADDLTRMRMARMARGASGRAAGELLAVANSVGTVFVRSYERGERVHLAMRARGYTGQMPTLDHAGSVPRWTVRTIVRCTLLPAAAVLTLVTTLVVNRVGI